MQSSGPVRSNCSAVSSIENQIGDSAQETIKQTKGMGIEGMSTREMEREWGKGFPLSSGSEVCFNPSNHYDMWLI